MAELLIRAEVKQLEQVMSFLQEEMKRMPCPQKKKQQIELVAEEIFVNIAQYAYGPEGGEVRIEAGFEKEGSCFFLRFTDSGRAYNPLQREDPDISMEADKRKIGGLGIYFVKRLMDEVSYQYLDFQNILWMKKEIASEKPDPKAKADCEGSENG